MVFSKTEFTIKHSDKSKIKRSFEVGKKRFIYYLKKCPNSGFEVSSLCSLFRSGGYATYTTQATQAAASIAVFDMCNGKNNKIQINKTK